MVLQNHKWIKYLLNLQDKSIHSNITDYEKFIGMVLDFTLQLIFKKLQFVCWRGCREKGTLLHCWESMPQCSHYGKQYEGSLKKLELPYNPAFPLLGLYSNKMNTLIQKDTCTSIFIAVLFTVAKTRKQLKCPLTGEWIKMQYIHTVKYYLSIKRKEIMPFAATWMNLEIIILSEVSQTEKDKFHTTSLICGT